MTTGGTTEYPFEEKYEDVKEHLPKFKKIYELSKGTDAQKKQGLVISRELEAQGLVNRFGAYKREADGYFRQLRTQEEQAKKQIADTIRAMDNIDDCDTVLKNEKKEIFYLHNTKAIHGYGESSCSADTASNNLKAKAKPVPGKKSACTIF